MSVLGKYSLQNSAVNGDLSDIWGYVDPQGSEYAIVGTENGVSIVDVTQPSNLVEIASYPHVNTVWRDIKTYGHYAYITNEAADGLMIIDLSTLPGPPPSSAVSFYTGSAYQFTTAHNLYIDENGVAYIFGANYGNGGAIMLDVTGSNGIPQELGVFDTYYLHDGMARNDTLWGSAINNGEFFAIDVSNKMSPTILGSHVTPGFYTHNSWVSDNGKVVYTTDEVAWGRVASYDVQDINNIFQLDEIQSSEGASTIPHNVHVKDNFLVISYYHDGVYVVDATLPHNMFVVGYYDTAPNYVNDGFNGCWGVYPWFPSGRIIASDVNEGLYVLSVSYKQAAYLKGTVRDYDTDIIITTAEIEIAAINDTLSTNLLGEYETAIFDSANYLLKFTADGYRPDSITVSLSYGQTTIADMALRGIHSSIDELEKKDGMGIFPNPVSEIMNISLNESEGKIIPYTIRTIEGKMLSQGQEIVVGGGIELVPPIISGTYILELETSTGKLVEQFIKQ